MTKGSLRILILAGQFYPDIAGSAVATDAIATSLAKKGHSVTVLCDSNNKKCLDKLDKLYQLKFADNYKSFMTGDNSFKQATQSIYSLLSNCQFDVIHVQSYLPMLLVSLMGRVIKTPVVFTFWSTPYKQKRSIGFYPESDLDMQLSSSIIRMKQYDRMILGSRAAYASAITQGADPTRTTMSYYGIDMEEFDEQLQKATLNTVYDNVQGLSTEDILILHPGRIVERKGIRESVEAFADVNKVYPSKLLLLGLIEPQDKLFAKAIEDLIERLGITDRVLRPVRIIQRDSIAAFYQRAQVVLSPSYSENLGFAAIESLRASRPLVATDVPGLNEFLRSGDNCLLVPPKNVQLLAKAISRLLSDESLVEKITTGGPESVVEFSIENFVEDSLRVYNEVIG